MNPRCSPSLRKKLTLQVVLPASLIALCGVGLISGTAQSVKEEREIEDQIPAHLPIKVKVRNLEKVKDLENDQWMQDVEVEVKNVSDKPIYFLRFSLYFKDLYWTPNSHYGVPLRYGRYRLSDFTKRPLPEDIPIKPGEIQVLRVRQTYVKGWKHHRTLADVPQPKKIGLMFHALHYGDGTGFNTTGGLPVPNRN